MNNKKGFIPLAAIPLGTIIVGAILIFLIFIGAFTFITINKFVLAGITIIVLEIIYVVPAAMSGDFTREKAIFLVIMFIVAIFVMFLPNLGILQQSVLASGEELTYLVPHKAAIKCDIIETSQIQADIPTGGVWISKSNIGFKSKIVKDIHVSADIGSGIGSCGSFSSCRIRWKICDTNQANCIENTADVNYNTAGNDLTYEKTFTSIDLTTQSLFIVFEKATNFPLYNRYDKEVLNDKIFYNAEKYGLNIYSTTAGFTTICITGCDLSCPQQGIREKIIETPLTTLNFLESVNYIEFWDEVAQMGTQNGATIYNADKKEFCFGGFIYGEGRITTETGKKYVYPETYKWKKDCCPGAVIQSTSSSQICNSNYVWETINENTQISCISDEQCPGSGITYVQKEADTTLMKKESRCVNNICTTKNLGIAECAPPSIGCATDQICDSNFKCVLGSPNLIPDDLGNNGENGETCIPEWYQVKRTTETVDSGLLGWRKLFNMEKTITTTECVFNPVITLAILLSGGIILVVIIFISTKPAKKRRK